LRGAGGAGRRSHSAAASAVAPTEAYPEDIGDEVDEKGDVGWSDVGDGAEDGESDEVAVDEEAAPAEAEEDGGSAKKTAGASSRIVCLRCFRSPEEIEWYEMKKTIKDNQIVLVAKASACMVHGLAAEAWPDESISELFESLVKDGKKNSQFVIVENRVIQMLAAGVKWSELTPASVSGRNFIGARVSTRFGLIATSDFSDCFGVPIADVPSVKLLNDLMNEEGHTFNAVMLPLHELPEKWRCRTIEFYSDVGTSLKEEALKAHLVLSDGHARSQYQASTKQCLQQRDPFCRIEKWATVRAKHKYNAILSTVQQAQADKIKNEKLAMEAAAASRTAAQEEEVEDGGRRGQKLTFGMQKTGNRRGFEEEAASLSAASGGPTAKTWRQECGSFCCC
jgi:hypothetical protein